MSFNKVLKKLPELSSSELSQLSIAIEDEFLARSRRKNRDLLKKWESKSETRAAMSKTLPTKQGWVSVYVLLEGAEQEMFRAFSTDQDSSQELAAAEAVQHSRLVGLHNDPMILG